MATLTCWGILSDLKHRILSLSMLNDKLIFDICWGINFVAFSDLFYD